MKKNKKIYLFAFLCLIIVVAVSSIITWAVRSNPTEPISSVLIKSDDYNEPGGWTIQKSAYWLSKNKAAINFKLNTVTKTNNHKKSVIFVVDNSESLNTGNRIGEIKDKLKSIVNYILNDENNKVALITFNSSSEVLSNFTNDKETITDLINDIEPIGETNYNEALLNVENILNNYQKGENEDLVTVILTDGKPTVDTPNQIVTYERLKDSYPFLIINGVQYKVSSNIMEELEQITDEQFSADNIGLYNAILRASIDPYVFDQFIIEDYIENEYYKFNQNNNIYASVGSANFTTEDGQELVTWNLGNDFVSGSSANLTFYVELKDEFLNVPGLYPTNNYEKVTYKVKDGTLKVKESDLTPVLKNYYTVTYDNNLPEDCQIESFPVENYVPFSTVPIRTDKLSCDGYTFNGWKLTDASAKRIGDDYFVMPEWNVTIRATWSKPSISKSMDGSIHERTTLYQKVKDDALNTSNADTYNGSHNDGGGNENIYYYNGGNNYVNFGGYCWRMLRTTDTGGVKLQFYSTTAEDGSCRGYKYYSGYIGFSNIQIRSNYVYGTDYTYDGTTGYFKLSGDMNTYSWQTQSNDIIGKYTCQRFNADDTCVQLIKVISYKDANNANVMNYYGLTTTTSGIGSIKYNNNYKSLANVGYMYNDEYNYDTKSYNTNNVELIYSNSFANNFYYSDQYHIEDTRYYKLDDASLLSEEQYNSGDLSSLVGMYTLRNSDADALSGVIYYIVATEGKNIYYIQISGGKTLEDYQDDIYFGDELINNNNGTYSLSGNISTVKLKDWYSHYSEFVDLYTCNSNSQTCSNPYYTLTTTNRIFKYEDGTRNYVYGNSFEYDENLDEYTLKDTVTFNGFSKNYDKIKTHHYTCYNTTGKCQTLSYIFYIPNNYTTWHIYLNNNENVTTAINKMLYDDNVNTIDSNIKATIDYWYNDNLAQYESYLEDVIYCNDRTISDYGGWDPDGGNVTWTDTNRFLKFLNYKNLGNNLTIANASLACSSVKDSFTVSPALGNGKLSNPIGLATSSEAILGSSVVNGVLMDPMIFDNEGSKTSGASFISTYISLKTMQYGSGAFPVISLKPGTEYTSGNGSIQSPLFIPTD